MLIAQRIFPAVLLLLPALCEGAAVREIRYAGALLQHSGDEELVLRQFEILVLQQEQELFFSVLDDERAGAPWPESFGRFVHHQAH